MTCSSLGFIGLGAMGMPMARNLLRKGFQVTVVRHRDPDAPAVLAALGAAVVDSPLELGGRAEVVILMLPTSREVEEVVLGSGELSGRGPSGGGLAGVMRPGQIVLDMGTSDPASTRRLADQLAVQGVAFLDAPVTGGVKGAEAGTLTIMVGGPSDVAERSGIARSTVFEVLEHGSADSATLRGVAARLREERFDPGFKLALARKDMRLAETLAEAVDVRLEVAAAARAKYDRACDAGMGDLDTTAIAATRQEGV